jgi:hypothetical protein
MWRKNKTLADNLALLGLSVSDLKAERSLGPLQNDVYEAMDDLCHLGQRAVAGDTRVDYPARAESDFVLFGKLRNIISAIDTKGRERYLPLLDCAESLLRQIAQIPIPTDGHLGVHRAIRSRFDFLFKDYGFTVVGTKPTNMRLVSGPVAVELGWATQASQSFSIRRGDLGDFWIEDLLYLHGDERYLTVPQAIHLRTEADVDAWFRFISEALGQYGDEQLRDSPGAFERLAQAQAQRDAEYAAMMDAKHRSD